MSLIADFVVGVARDVKSIEGMEYAAEIMDEYKRSRSLGCAIDIVQSRHKRIEEERRQAAAREEAMKREREAVARVEAAAPPVILEPPVKVPAKPAKPEFPESFGFVMHFTSKTQWDAVKPKLLELKEIILKEGIRLD